LLLFGVLAQGEELQKNDRMEIEKMTEWNLQGCICKG
jgi:hypothetical protein